MITLFTRAPDPHDAARLANAATAGLSDYIRRAEARNGIPPVDRVQVRQLGPPEAKWVNRGARVMLGGLAFVGAVAACVLILVAAARISNALVVDRSRRVHTYDDHRWLDHPTLER